MGQRIYLDEVIFEMVRYGRILRVIAIDPLTGTEVLTSGPLSAGEKHLKRVAKRKLEYVLTKRATAAENQ